MITMMAKKEQQRRKKKGDEEEEEERERERERGGGGGEGGRERERERERGKKDQPSWNNYVNSQQRTLSVVAADDSAAVNHTVGCTASCVFKALLASRAHADSVHTMVCDGSIT